MDSHNPKTETVVKKESVRVETDHKGARVLQTDVLDAPELSIDEDFDIGCDPYNSTGQHVIIKSRKDPAD